MKIKTIALAGVAGLALSAAAIGSANAEPNGAPTYRALAGVGSDTTQDVVNGLSDAVVDGSGTKLIGSYNATGGGNITTKDPSTNPNCTFARPNGSGAGRTALIKAQTTGDPTFGCIDFSRSSSLDLSQAAVNLTYIPFAVDAVTYARAAGSTVPSNLTKAQLTAIYQCQVPDIQPLLPQAGSGTRKFWLAQLGLSETTFGTCVKDVQADGKTPIQEHDGRVLTSPNMIVPFSVAQYLAQSFGVITDVRGSAQLGRIDGVTPVALNTNFGVKRDVYNVVPTANLTNSTISNVFVGGSSQVCSQTSVIQNYGFGLNAKCGDTTNRTAG